MQTVIRPVGPTSGGQATVLAALQQIVVLSVIVAPWTALAAADAKPPQPADSEQPAQSGDTGSTADGPLPGHSYHGAIFDEGPRQKAYLMGTCGDVSFPATSKNPEVQAFINQGIAQLHGFWYLEAERSFRQAATLDPDCAIAYWSTLR